jgi:dTDP-4-amino-4,6-dideoxygalactose transaminase
VIPILKCKLPTIDQCLPYLREIDQSRIYSNLGPLELSFRSRIKEEFLPLIKSELVTTCNATLALEQVLRYWTYQSSSKKRFVICPSWTFVATVSAIINSNLIPILIDCDYLTELPSIPDIQEVIDSLSIEEEVVALLITMPFGSPVPINDYVDLVKKLKIKLLIDGAAGLDALSSISKENPAIFTEFTAVVSFHATKTYGIGEGGLIITQSDEEMENIRAFGNFGFKGNRDASSPGFNSKLSEYMAAVGLAMVDNIDEEKNEWLAVREKFRELCNSKPYIIKTPQLEENYISSYGNIRLDLNYFKNIDIEAKLTEFGIETRKWWGGGVHKHKYYKSVTGTKVIVPGNELSHTDKIAKEMIGLPYFRELKNEDIEKIFLTLESLQCL